MLSACCNERSIAVIYGTLRYRTRAGQHVSPRRVARFPSSRQTAMSPADLWSGMDSASAARTVVVVVGHRGTTISSRRRQRRSRPRTSGPSRSSQRCSTWPIGPLPASRQARRRDGILTPDRRLASKPRHAYGPSLQPGVPPRTPFARSPTVNHGSLQFAVAGYPQVNILLVSTMIPARPSELSLVPVR